MVQSVGTTEKESRDKKTKQNPLALVSQRGAVWLLVKRHADVYFMKGRMAAPWREAVGLRRPSDEPPVCRPTHVFNRREELGKKAREENPSRQMLASRHRGRTAAGVARRG